MCLLVVACAVDARLVHFLFAIIVNCVHALVLLDGNFLVLYVLDPVLCAGAVVLIAGLCIFFMILSSATVDCSTLETTGVDIVDNFWVGCVIDIV